MSDKSYLKNQIKLVSLNARDTFTQDEFEKYMELVSYINEIDRLAPSKVKEDIILKKEFLAKKKQAKKELSAMVKLHADCRI